MILISYLYKYMAKYRTQTHWDLLGTKRLNFRRISARKVERGLRFKFFRERSPFFSHSRESTESTSVSTAFRLVLPVSQVERACSCLRADKKPSTSDRTRQSDEKIALLDRRDLDIPERGDFAFTVIRPRVHLPIGWRQESHKNVSKAIASIAPVISGRCR